MRTVNTTDAVNAKAQAILFQLNTFKPSIMPKGMRLKIARMALMNATIQNMSWVIVATSIHPVASMMLVRGPERAVLPALSFVTDPTIITAPGEMILNGGGRKIEIRVIKAPCMVNRNSAHN